MKATDAFRAAFENARQQSKTMQVHIFSVGPIGPSEVVPVDGSPGVYLMRQPLQVGAGQVVFHPMVFDLDHVIWFSTGPVDADGKPITAMPGAPGAPKSGLHISGRH